MSTLSPDDIPGSGQTADDRTAAATEPVEPAWMARVQDLLGNLVSKRSTGTGGPDALLRSWPATPPAASDLAFSDAPKEADTAPAAFRVSARTPLFDLDTDPPPGGPERPDTVDVCVACFAAPCACAEP